MSRLRSLDAVVASGLCAGCGLCAAMVPSITMRISARGFARPSAEDPSAAELARILSVCPGARLDGPPAAPSTHAVWGPVRALHRAWATDPAVRWAGASGGVITALCAHLLATDAVDAVLHVGAEAQAPLWTSPQVSTTTTQLVDRAGSRYAPSPVLAGLDDALARHARIAVVGKPCDIAALRRHVATDPSLAARIPWMLSFFCAGVPSLVGTEILVRRMGLDPATLTELRYRGRGWPGRMTAEAADGRTASMSYTDSWGGELHGHLQFRCKICPDGTGEHADIAAADAWLTRDGYPDFEERDGISAVLARTERGAALLAVAVAAGAIETAPLAPAELMAMQPYQVRRKRVLLGRLAALRLLGQRVPRYRGLRLWRNALRGGRALLRDFVGTGLRVLQGRHRE